MTSFIHISKKNKATNNHKQYQDGTFICFVALCSPLHLDVHFGASPVFDLMNRNLIERIQPSTT